MSNLFHCPSLTTTGRRCAAPVRRDGYCSVHEPVEWLPAILLAPRRDDHREAACPLCGTVTEDAPGRTAPYVAPDHDLGTGPICDPCLRHIDPVVADLFDLWRNLAAQLEPDVERYLNLALIGDLDSQHVHFERVRGAVTIPSA